MKAGIEEARIYLQNMRTAMGDKLINPDSIYYGREGHLRLARECGYALNDFEKVDRMKYFMVVIAIFMLSA